jgi:hypothetical protein
MLTKELILIHLQFNVTLTKELINFGFIKYVKIQNYFIISA